MTLSAVTVAGQCRERSPADEAVFGEQGARFADRFADPAEGQRLLAEAVSAGAAEATARLRGASGALVARVSLWRQRGGDRIRLIAAFAPEPEPPAPAAPAAADPAQRTQARLQHYAGLLRPPVEAALGVLGRLRRSLPGARADAPAGLGDTAAVLWRVLWLTDEMAAPTAPGPPGGARLDGEVDVLRLARRLVRLAQPAAAAQGAVLHVPTVPAGGGPGVQASQVALWTALESAIDRALAVAGPGGEVALSLCEEDSLTLQLSATPAAGSGATPPAPTGGATPPAPSGGETLPALGGDATAPAPTGGATSPAPSGGAIAPAPVSGGTLPAPESGATLPAPGGGGTLPASSGGATPPAPIGGVTSPAPSGGATAPAP
ncbi:MAG: hypothetical protein AAF677_09155, partial [Pseudomonadota bacterium]